MALASSLPSDDVHTPSDPPSRESPGVWGRGGGASAGRSPPNDPDYREAALLYCRIASGTKIARMIATQMIV